MKLDKPTIIAALFCVLGSMAAAETPSRNEIATEIIDYLQGLAEEGFGGAVLIARGDEEPLAYGFGWANREKRIPWSPETVFSMGSITKPFTATAILKLYEDGKLSLDDTLTRWFDGVPEDKSKVTLHHLLTHSAGVRPNFGGDFSPRATREWLLDKILQSPLLWGEEDLGVKYEYSNAGYSLLAMIVENASGMPYEKYLWETFFKPLGMTDTGYSIPGWGAERFARGYENGEDWGVVAEKHALPDGPNWNLRGNGGLHTTMRDLYTWYRALVENHILTSETRKIAEHPHVAENPGGTSHYGYGWAIATTARETKFIGHNGGNGIFFADLRRYDDDNETLILLATNTAADFDDLPIVRKLRLTVFPSQGGVVKPEP